MNDFGDNQLIYCNTLYQLMVAINIKKNILEKANVDIVLTDHTVGMKKIAMRLKEKAVFREIFYVEVREIDKGEKCLYNKNNKFEKVFGIKKQVEKKMHLYAEYESLWGACPTEFSRLLYSYLCIKSKRTLDYYCFEDGLATYCDAHEWFVVPRGIKHRILNRKLAGRRDMIEGLKGMWVFKPELLKCPLPCEVFRLPMFDDQNIQMINLLNEVFGYNEICEKYENYRYIYFEQTFKAIGDRDVEILKEVANKVGVDNIIVKLHPRSMYDRFEKHGFKTNAVLTVPSELILLNCNPNKTKLVSVFSSSLVVPWFSFGLRFKTITLLKLFDRSTEKTLKRMYDFFVELNKKDAEMFALPESIEEAVSILRE